MASQGEMRAWMRANGFSVNPKGSLDRESEDMYFVGTSGWGIEPPKLRKFVQDCRAWVKVNEWPALTDKVRLSHADVNAYVEHLTDDSIPSVLVDDSPYNVIDTITIVDAEPQPVIGPMDGYTLAVAQHYADEEEAYRMNAEKNSVVTLDRRPALVRVREQERAGLIYTMTMAVSEMLTAVGMVGGTPEDAEKACREVTGLAEYVGASAGVLGNEFHMMYCTGCGHHNNRTDQY